MCSIGRLNEVLKEKPLVPADLSLTLEVYLKTNIRLSFIGNWALSVSLQVPVNPPFASASPKAYGANRAFFRDITCKIWG